MPRDRFHRQIDYLRISLVDHCNLRCVYCMPMDARRSASGSPWLTASEIETVARAAVGVGFRKFRLTGGEPTLRADLVEIVERIARIDGVRDLALTTNGVLLPRVAPALARAGLRRVNVHLDTLDRERLAKIMRLGTLEEIWAGIEAAERAGLLPIKLNAVVTRGFNDEDVVSLAALTRDRAWHVRFIELMPLGGGEPAEVSRSGFVPSAETEARIVAELGPLIALESEDPSDESRNTRLAGALGTIGFISPVSRPYCGTCNRMRLTAEGKFHLCLLNDDELDVRRALAQGGVSAVADVLLRAVGAKPTGHRLHENETVARREMFQLGG
ncbi:MAG: GTP 3',8-cyclase MoaA [Deltaproteobacteria bacterium]|nr:GTP 3',8-cyclase MoaA [Deltaproteobacteria bacterium]